jgi:hypothetical protein
MLSRTRILPLALVALGGARLASAANYDQGQWVTSFTAGSNLVSTGTFTSQMIGTADLGNIDPVLTGIPVTTTLSHLEFRDAFADGPSFGLETGYMAQSNLEPFVRLSYSEMRGRFTDIGQFDSPAFVSPGVLTADMDDVNSWALNLGTRYFLAETGTMRAFVAGYLGANRVDAMRATFAVGGSPETAVHEEILPQRTSFDAGAEGGVSWQIADQADLSLSLGAQYVDAHHSSTDAFAPLGIDQVQFSDQRWSFPVNLGLDYRF